MYLAFADHISFCLSVSVHLFLSLAASCQEKKKKTIAGNTILYKAICLSFSAPSLSLDDLFDCIATLGSSFRRLSQRKPCHNSEFLTGLQLPGRATVDQHWINTRDKLPQSRAQHMNWAETS